MEADNLVLEHLRHIRGKVDAIYEVLGDHGDRLLRVENRINALRREQIADAEGVVGMQEQVGQVRRRMGLIGGENGG